jgi:DNA polymerase III subunit beta
MTDVLSYLASSEPSQSYEKVAEQEFDNIRFQVEKQVLLGLLDKISAVVPSKADNSAIKNFQVEVSDTLKITGTDGMHMMIMSTKLFEPIARGTMLLPAKIILEILRSVPDSLVDIECTASSIIVVIGNASWELRKIEGVAFPKTPSLVEAVPEIVDRKNFIDAMESVRYAVAKDVARPGLKMIDLRHDKMTACDGVRFQQSKVTAPAMQIPGGSIELILKVLGSSASENMVFADLPVYLVFKVDKTMLLVKKPTAKFPHAEQLFLRPALTNDLELKVSRAALISAIKHVRLCADEDTSAIALKLSKNSIEVSTRDQPGNKSSEVIEAVWTGKTRTLTVHHRYMLELLSVNDTETCKIMLGEDSESRKSPILLQNEEAGKVGVVQQMFLGSLAGYTI